MTSITDRLEQINKIGETALLHPCDTPSGDVCSLSHIHSRSTYDAVSYLVRHGLAVLRVRHEGATLHQFLHEEDLSVLRVINDLRGGEEGVGERARVRGGEGVS